LRNRAGRYPARPILLVTRITSAPDKEAGKAPEDADEEEDVNAVPVPADKQKAQLIEGTTVLPSPLWAPTGDKIRCKVIIGPDGKIAKLDTGAQLCEAVQWAQFSYKPTIRGGRPVSVKTEVEVLYEPRK
jgi:hypothetical protein